MLVKAWAQCDVKKKANDYNQKPAEGVPGTKFVSML